MLKIRDIAIYDGEILIYVVKKAKSYREAFVRFEKETGKTIPQAGYSARNYEKI